MLSSLSPYDTSRVTILTCVRPIVEVVVSNDEASKGFRTIRLLPPRRPFLTNDKNHDSWLFDMANYSITIRDISVLAKAPEKRHVS